MQSVDDGIIIGGMVGETMEAHLIHDKLKVRSDVVIQCADSVTRFAVEEIGLDHFTCLCEAPRAVADSTNISNR